MVGLPMQVMPTATSSSLSPYKYHPQLSTVYQNNSIKTNKQKKTAYLQPNSWPSALMRSGSFPGRKAAAYREADRLRRRLSSRILPGEGDALSLENVPRL